MLKIRSEQIEVLRESVRKEFEDDMVIHLQTGFSSEIDGMSEDELRQEIRLGIEKAEQYDIVISTDVSRFIEYSICYGNDFDVSTTLKWIPDILNDNNLDGTEKMDKIDETERKILLG